MAKLMKTTAHPVKAISALLTLLPLLCLGIADVDIDIENSNYMLGRAAADAARAVIKRIDGSQYATEQLFNKYQLTEPCQHRSLMVCKSCAARDMERVTFTATEQGLQVWCMEAGIIENIGELGFENWRFSGCLDRPEDHIVKFKSCREMH